MNAPVNIEAATSIPVKRELDFINVSDKPFLVVQASWRLHQARERQLSVVKSDVMRSCSAVASMIVLLVLFLGKAQRA